MRVLAALILTILAPVFPAAGQEPPASDPAASDRVLDVLAAPPAPASGPETGAGGQAAAAESGCPRAALAALFATSTDAKGIGPALALERETLVLCKERAQIAAEIFELENKLREAAGAAAGQADADASAPPEEVPEVDSASFASQLSTPPAASPASLPPPALKLPAPASAPPAAPPGPVAKAEPDPAPAAEAPPPQRFAWFSIIGAAGRLQAGISDGEGVWFVAEGDSIGGATVERIRSRPPAVLLTDGRELPWVGSPPRGER